MVQDLWLLSLIIPSMYSKQKQNNSCCYWLILIKGNVDKRSD